MKLDTITMDKVQAREQYMVYRSIIRAGGGSPEDAMLARGYRSLALGHSLVDVRAAIRMGGLGNDGFPRIGIARADTPRLWCRIRKESRLTMRLHALHMTKGGWRKGHHWRVDPSPSEERSLVFDLSPAEDFPGQLLPPKVQATIGVDKWASAEAYTIVPNIPATLKPSHGLDGYHILFEVESWHVETPRPPRDPALLKHVGGDLYAVLAVWDLTPLERAVIAGTRMRRTS